MRERRRGGGAHTATGGVLIIPTPANQQEGTFPVTGATLAIPGAATLTSTSGTVTLTLAQHSEGLVGSYDLKFGASVLRGTFTAPTCDVCALVRGP